jgi:hypothetical protein
MTNTERVVLAVGASLIVFIVGYVLFFGGSGTLLFSALGLTILTLLFLLATLTRRTSR